MADTQSRYQFGVLNAFRGIGTPSIYGINNNGIITVEVELNEAKASINGFTTKVMANEAIDLAQRACGAYSLVDEDKQFDFVVTFLSMLVSKSYVLQDEPQDDGADAIAEQNYLDADIEAWQFEKAGVSL